jgi:HlyD family type I secretion membrane fusion protein
MISTRISPRTDLGVMGRITLLVTCVFFATVLIWASLTQISGAVITPGQAGVPGKPSVVQHLDGGIVETILVANGDRVVGGQLLMKLDPTLIRLNRDVAMGRLGAALALRSALPFEAPEMALARAGQISIFTARAAARQGRGEQLAERIAQINNQIDGSNAQIRAYQEQLALIERELGNVSTLFDKGMVRESQLLSLMRDRAAIMGYIAGDEAERARLKNSIRDAQLEVTQAENAFLEQVSTDLRATVAEVEEQILQIATLNDQLSRIDIRAPSDGVVHEMQVTTEGGVVAPRAVIMQIVPQSKGVEFEMRLAAQDLDRAHTGQPAQLLFPTLDPRVAPRLQAEVALISPAAVTDEQTGQSFYRLTLSVSAQELARLGDVKILPGLPVEAYLQTGDRSVMSYLLAPRRTYIPATHIFNIPFLNRWGICLNFPELLPRFTAGNIALI